MEHPPVERLQLYVDQRLADNERIAIDRHLAGCEECATREAGLKRLVRGLTTMDSLMLPASFASELTEEIVPSPNFAVEPVRRRLFFQAAICLIILLTCGALLTIIDTPITDPSNDVLGAVDMLLGSPFQEQAPAVAVLAIMAVAGIGIIACLIAAMPAIRPRRAATVPSRNHRPRGR